MDKRSSPIAVANYGKTVTPIDLRSPGNLKRLCIDENVPDEIAKVAFEISQSPSPDHSYFYVRALGAGERYGPNANGDFFAADELRARHSTFVKVGKLYRHHVTTADPTGDVLASAYNELNETVDLIVRAPNALIEHDIRKIAQDMVPLATSMGASVPYDECSYCSNKAKTRLGYCLHARTMLNKPFNGRLVYLKNPSPTFKDISLVVVPAAPESAAFYKVASFGGVVLGKRARIQKEITQVEPSRAPVPPSFIRATSNLDPSNVIMAIHEGVGVVRPDEFVSIVTKNASHLVPDVNPVVFGNAFGGGSNVRLPVPSKLFVKMAAMHYQPIGLMDYMFDMPQELIEDYLSYRVSTRTMAPGEPYLRF